MRKANIRPNILVFMTVAIIVFMFPLLCSAVPAAPGVHTLSQPDGSTFEAKQWGDESHRGWETVDGYTIEFHEGLKHWKYRDNEKNVNDTSTHKIVGKDHPPVDVPKHARPAASYVGKTSSAISAPQQVPLATGTNNIPVILVNFSNTTTTYTSTAFNALLFGTGNHSMNDYYQEVSYGKFSVSPGTKGIAGWYTAANTHDYYGQNAGGFDAWPGDLVYEAVKAADDAKFDFSQYDQDGDCYVDVVNIVHQGTGEEAGGPATDIWSHSWDLNSAKYYKNSNFGEYTTNTYCSANPSKKVKVNKYVIQPEILWGEIQTMGVFAHEYGHAIGLPDLYDTDGSSEGIGNWSLMAGGTWNYVTKAGDRPAHMDAWSKYKLGWVSPTLVSGTLNSEQISQAATSNDVYQLLNGSPTSGGEYFLVENRQMAGFDEGLPGAGLLIWHIDESKSSNNSECYPGGPSCATNHYKVALIQSDNLWYLEKHVDRGNSGDPYHALQNNTTFTDTSSPNSRLYNNSSSNVSITSISSIGSNMIATLSVIPTASADLIISSLSAPSTAAAGQSIAVNDTTKNNGTGTAGASTTKFYWSTNATYDAVDTYLGTRDVSALAAGITSTGGTIVTIPAGVKTGTYYIIAKADADSAVTETSEINNDKAVSIKIVGPDLIVSALTAPTSALHGSTISVTDTTKNSGGATAGGSVTKLYLSTNTTYDVRDVYLGERVVPTLAAGATSAGAKNVTIPASTVAGRYYIIGVADANSAVTETSETNNTTYKVITIK
jgi:immune inhibitor A